MTQYFWVFLALGSQLVAAVVFLIDKYLITSPAVSKPPVYAFYVSVLSIIVLVMLPFGLVFKPTVEIIILSLIIAYTFTFSILFLYKALKISEASDASPVMGAISAVSAFGFSVFILHDKLPNNFFVGFILFVIGTILLSRFRLSKQAVKSLIIAGVLFGLSSVFLKSMFLKTSFPDGFFWSRMANVLAGFTLLLWPSYRGAIKENFLSSTRGTKGMIIGNKFLAGVGFLLNLMAIDLGNVSLVSAMVGLQFVFIFTLGIFFTKALPKYFHEVQKPKAILSKVIAILIIGGGFFILFL